VRILHVIQELAPGGAERVAVALVRGSQARGDDVAVAAAPGSFAAGLDTDLFPIPIVDRRISRLPIAARAIARARRSFRPDLVHAHNPGMAAAVSLATLRGRRPPGVATLQGVPDEDYAQAARVFRLAGLPVIACGSGVAAALAEHGLSVRATIVNSVPPATEPANRQALVREWGLRNSQRLIVAVGRLVPQKNHALAIRALAAVPDAILVVVGGGPLREPLEREAKASGVRDRVVLAGPRSDARAVIGAADVVVLPSHWEGLPLVGLEALAAGTPLVATAVLGVRDLVSDGESALLVPPGDERALAGALKRVLDDRELADRLRAKGLEIAAEHSEETMVARYYELYQELLGGR
jgi:glycosyltransferase involved in cell wall biosynthesis